MEKENISENISENIKNEINREIKNECCNGNKKNKCNNVCTGGGLYCLGFIGAAIYFIGSAATFGLGVLGFLKAIVWPAFIVYELLKFFHL